MPNGRWAKESGAIVARAVLAGLTPLNFRDHVRCRVQLEDPSSDPYRGLQLTEEMSQNTWATIDECQRGARSSRRGGYKYLSGDSSPQVEATGLGVSGSSTGESCWSCVSPDHKKQLPDA